MSESTVRTRLFFPAAALAYALTAMLNALLVIAKESIGPLKQLLYAGGHHWSSQWVLLMIVLVCFWLLIRALRIDEKLKLTMSGAATLTLVSTLVSGVLILGFYLIHYL